MKYTKLRHKIMIEQHVLSFINRNSNVVSCLFHEKKFPNIAYQKQAINKIHENRTQCGTFSLLPAQSVVAML